MRKLSGFRDLWIVEKAVWVVLLAVLACRGEGQTLAHRNWQGSGLSPKAWWDREIFCGLNLDEPGAAGLTRMIARLDALNAMGCDGVESRFAWGEDASGLPVSASVGTLEDADSMISEVGRRRMRLVLELPLGASAGSPATERVVVERMKFWLARGVAGFVLTGDLSISGGRDSGALLRRLRTVTAAAPGSRVLMSDGISRESTAGGVQLAFARLGQVEPDAAERLRERISGLNGTRTGAAIGLRMGDGSVSGRNLARARAAVLLLLGPAALLNADGVEPEHTAGSDTGSAPAGTSPALQSSDELTDWYRGLADLHHGHAALRAGKVSFFDRDGQGVLAWVVRPPGTGGGTGVPLLVVCNLASAPVRVALGADLKAMGVRRTYLRTLMRSDHPVFGATLDSIDLPGGGVLVGEIR